jgi:hypothetical protein
MKHPFSHIAKLPIRWHVVGSTIVIILAAIAIAVSLWYMAIFTLPQEQHASLIQKFDDLEIQTLANQMLHVEQVLHLSHPPHA